MIIFQFLISYKCGEIRIFLEEQEMAREHYTQLKKFVHRFTIMQYLNRSSVSNCSNSNFIGISRQKLTKFCYLTY